MTTATSHMNIFTCLVFILHPLLPLCQIIEALSGKTSPQLFLTVYTKHGEAVSFPEPPPGVTIKHQLALEHTQVTLEAGQVPLLTHELLEDWVAGGEAGREQLQQLHEYLGSLACGIGES